MPVKWSKPKTAGAKPKAKKPVNENRCRTWLYR